MRPGPPHLTPEQTVVCRGQRAAGCERARTPLTLSLIIHYPASRSWYLGAAYMIRREFISLLGGAGTHQRKSR
jgi:hypothetical protein